MSGDLDPPPTTAVAPLDEPVRESAPLAARIAPELCCRDPATNESCAWYHGFWQYLRVLDLAKTSGGHVDFLVGQLRTLARTGRFAHVLVSGSGDYSMPAHVLWAYAAERAAIELAVVDRCETPLTLSRWYAARRGASIVTYATDILDYATAVPFDVVMTNSFLGYFDPAARARLFAAWRRLLRRGGKLLLTNRLRPQAGDEPVGFTAEQARSLCDTVRRAAAARREELGVDPETLAHAAQLYAARFRSHPVHSADEVTALLRDNGFAVDRLDSRSAAAGKGGAVSGPTTAEAADYVRVLATRR
ncbi:MAG: class I SAM-dependent methyltransferase [Proteobacteria bacterium]|nr:class I SAM-dependent methyltransferase [Pseudomonadota bacterium]